MKITVQEILEKLTQIDSGISIVEGHIDSYGKQYSGQEPLNEVIDLLNEYKQSILETKVDI